jgi:post-segregation antitoxin (ccd killing protein)
MATYIMQGIGCSVHPLVDQTLNAKCKIITLQISEPFSIQNELHNTRTDGWCEESFGMYVKTANRTG